MQERSRRVVVVVLFVRTSSNSRQEASAAPLAIGGVVGVLLCHSEGQPRGGGRENSNENDSKHHPEHQDRVHDLQGEETLQQRRFDAKRSPFNARGLGIETLEERGVHAPSLDLDRVTGAKLRFCRLRSTVYPNQKMNAASKRTTPHNLSGKQQWSRVGLQRSVR